MTAFSAGSPYPFASMPLLRGALMGRWWMRLLLMLGSGPLLLPGAELLLLLALLLFVSLYRRRRPCQRMRPLLGWLLIAVLSLRLRIPLRLGSSLRFPYPRWFALVIPRIVFTVRGCKRTEALIGLRTLLRLRLARALMGLRHGAAGSFLPDQTLLIRGLLIRVLFIQAASGLSLPLNEGPGHSSGSSERYDLTAGHGGRWFVGNRPACAEDAGTGRLSRNRVRNRRRGQFPGRYRDDVARNGTRVDKSFARDHGHATVHATIGIGNVVDGSVYNHSVIDIVDSCNIYCRVRDVDAIHVSAAYPVTGNEDFSRSQREPSHTRAKGKREVEAGPTADPSH